MAVTVRECPGLKLERVEEQELEALAALDMQPAVKGHTCRCPCGGRPRVDEHNIVTATSNKAAAMCHKHNKSHTHTL